MQDQQILDEVAASQGDWKTIAETYEQYIAQRTAELALINSVQEGLSAQLTMQQIYDLVGDKLRDTFDAQVVMISQFDPATRQIFHRYAIERGQHLQIEGWKPLDSSRAMIVQTRKPFMINLPEIIAVVNAGKMQVVPGTELPKTWLGVPMLVRNEVRGIVSLQNLDREHAFTQSDIDLLLLLTSSMSMSLENARLFNEAQHLLRQIEKEMMVARQTQQSILPPNKPRIAGYDFGSLIIPARAVGGDFYDFIRLDQDRLSLVIGDVSDKGLPASLFMALTFSLLRAETGWFDDPRRIILDVNRYLLKMNASGMFVTLLYGILDTRTGHIRYARAGHPPPIILDADNQLSSVNISVGQPLGLFKQPRLDVQQVEIPPGGLALFFSDGLNEAIDAEGREFGLANIQQVLVECRHKSAQLICQNLWAAIESFSGVLPQQDDFTVVVVKRLRQN
jgi:serine phosphatase RsbU (regulator of sigma subunit)